MNEFTFTASGSLVTMTVLFINTSRYVFPYYSVLQNANKAY